MSRFWGAGQSVPIFDYRISCEPLSYAIYKDKPEIARLLIEKGADIKIAQKEDRSWPEFKMTPLHFAALKGDCGTSILLISKGADINAKNGDGQTSVHLARNTKMLEILSLYGGKLDEPDGWNMTPLFYAIMRNDDKMVSFLIAEGVNINHMDMNGLNALFYPAKNGYYEIAKLLVDKGIEVNVVDKIRLHNTPLHLAAESGNQKLISLLISKGASIYAKNKKGIRPIDYDSVKNNPEAIKILKRKNKVK